MARYYDSFEKLKENVTETHSNIAMLLEKFDWGFFSEDGQNKVEVYTILDDCFQIADDLEDLVRYVSDEIGKLKKKLDNSSLSEAVHTKAVINYLVKYIRFNLHEDFWKDYPEFNKNNARGC